MPTRTGGPANGQSYLFVGRDLTRRDGSRKIVNVPLMSGDPLKGVFEL